MKIQILAQDVLHSLVFVGTLSDFESSHSSHGSKQIFMGDDSDFEHIVVFENHRGVQIILDSRKPTNLNFARTFVVAVVEGTVLLWREQWTEARKVDTAWTNGWMTFHNDKFVTIADDTCLIHIDNVHEEIEYQHFPEIITDVRVQDGKLIVDLWK